MQTIGERLEEARKKKGISIREAAEATKIRSDYLQKFESNHFDLGLTEIYTRGFLRNYAAFLKLPADRLLNDYAALGRGEVKPRQVNREIYGRMDIPAPAAESASPGQGESSPPEPPPAPRAQPHYPRGRGASLPSGPDPAVVFQYVKWGVGAALGIAILLGALWLYRGKSAAAKPTTTVSPTTSTTTAPAAERIATITALETVVVQVSEKISDAPMEESRGAELLPQTTLLKGESRTVPYNGPLYVSASARQYLKIEIPGKPAILPGDWGQTGPGPFVLK